jgi:hypothetical protein
VKEEFRNKLSSDGQTTRIPKERNSMTNDGNEATAHKQQIYTYVVEVDVNPDGKTCTPTLYGPLSYEDAESLEHKRSMARRGDNVWIWLHASYSSDIKLATEEVRYSIENSTCPMDESRYAKIAARGTMKFYLVHTLAKMKDKVIMLDCGPFDSAKDAEAVRKQAKSKRYWRVDFDAEDTLEGLIKSKHEFARRWAELGYKDIIEPIGVSQDFVLNTDMKKWDKETEKQWKRNTK